MIEIHRYTAAYHRDWNDFVSESSNGTFLFLREYMEYHAVDCRFFEKRTVCQMGV